MWNWKILNASYSSDSQKSVKELTPDSGANFKRERYTTQDEFVDGNLLLTAEERRNFWDFYIRDVKQGEVRFIYNDCRVDTDKWAKFVGKPTESKQSNKFLIKLKLRLVG